MLTGYWIENGKIYGPNGYTRACIKNNHIYTDGCDYPVYWINDDVIHSMADGETQFYIENGFIYGPEETLPWMGKKQ